MLKQHKKEARNRDKLAELLGLEAPPKATSSSSAVLRQDRSREAEAVLTFVDKPLTFIKRACKVCGRGFLVDRSNVSCCSDTCRANGLKALGIEWDWSKPPESRWYFSYQGDKVTNEPLVVGPALLEALETLHLMSL
jgi:hypothetical protein